MHRNCLWTTGKKLLSFILACVLFTAVLTACADDTTTTTADGSTTSATSDTSGEDIVLRVSWWGNQVRNDNTVNALNGYTEDHPNITFEPEFSDWGGYWDKMAAQAASNSLPDIIQQDYAYITQYQSKDQLVNLTPYINDGIIDTTYIADSILEPANIDDKQYGISAGITLSCLEYDRKLVTDAGIEIPEQMTWDDFFSLSKTIFEKTGVQAYLPAEKKMLEIIARGDDQEFLSAEEHKISLKDDTLILKFFQMVEEGSDSEWHVTPDVLVEHSTDNIETDPINFDLVWCAFFNTNQVPSLVLSADKDLGITMYPQMTGAKKLGVNLGSSSWWCITSNSAHKDIAAAVIDYLTNSEKARDALGVERGTPSSSQMGEYIKPSLDEMQQEIIDFTNKVAKMDVSKAPATPAGISEFDKLMSDLVEKIRYDEITPEEATQQLVSEGNTILERAAE